MHVLLITADWSWHDGSTDLWSHRLLCGFVWCKEEATIPLQLLLLVVSHWSAEHFDHLTGFLLNQIWLNRLARYTDTNVVIITQISTEMTQRKWRKLSYNWTWLCLAKNILMTVSNGTPPLFLWVNVDSRAVRYFRWLSVPQWYAIYLTVWVKVGAIE